MAVFLINICKFNGCEKIFPSLNDLIQHIEDTHIDYDSQAPGLSEKTQSTCLPLSAVLRFISDNSRKDSASSPAVVSGSSNGVDKGKNASATPPGLRLTNASSINQNQDLHSTATNAGNGNNNGVAVSINGNSEQNGNGSSAIEPTKNHLNQPVGTTDLKRKIAIKHHSYSISASNRSTTPTGSEMDDDEMMVSESEDSNDSWTTEEFSSEFIMRYGSRRHSSAGGGNGINSSNEKPFACPVPGCKKRYKNVNGIKYHSKNGHKKDGNRVRKGFKCYCGKSYKTSQRLKNHNMLAHSSTQPGTIPEGAGLAAVPLASPALPSASLITSPVVSPVKSNGSTGGTSSFNGGNLSSSSTINSGSITSSTTSSQIGTNATTTSTSPSTLTITQVTHKIPRAHVLTATTAASTAATVAPTMAAVVASVATATVTTSNAFSVASATMASSTLSSVPSVMATPASIKYDNLGILTPATSPKLIANLCQDTSQPLLQPAGTAGVVLSGTGPAGIALKSVLGHPVGPSGASSGGTGELVGGGGSVGIALVVSSGVGNEAKLTSTTGAGTTGGNGGNKNTGLSASVAAGQLYADET
ncbi:uncharacterized protein DDB_G0271670 [Anopheles nili]|uniref:uncharacterized protein DDB_G0271670 n=1 Tax=Anopheles nili TaxID=185578 RepID=UPI00237C283C|nr:uncharacterized protein DDB_G0271670 [Anopheles nili]